MRRLFVLARPMVLAVLAVGWLVPVAMAADEVVTIQACVQPETGSIRIVGDAKQECAEFGEDPLIWNQQGPEGAPGPQGPAGPQGETGPAGETVARRWWRDADNDHFGDWYEFLDSPARPAGYVANRDDCHDQAAQVNPLSALPDTGRELVHPESSDRQALTGPFRPVFHDHDCNGLVGEDPAYPYRLDYDRDGAPSNKPWHYAVLTLNMLQDLANRENVYLVSEAGFPALDCDDSDPNIRNSKSDYSCYNPPRGFSNSDLDGDGHAGAQSGGDDCDDADRRRFPGNAEVSDIWGHDEDCDPHTVGVGGQSLVRDLHPWDDRRPVASVYPFHYDQPNGPSLNRILQPSAARPPAIIYPRR